MFNNMLMGAAGESIKATSFPVDNSAQFNDDDSEYLIRTPTSAGNQRTWTFSFWFKFGSLTGRQTIYGQSNAYISINENSSTSALINLYITGVDSPGWYWETVAQFRDPHAWYHVVVAFDSTHSTTDSRLRLYINGDEITDFTKHATGAQNNQHDIGGTSDMVIAKHPVNSAQYYDGYFAEYVYVNGSQLAPTSFGERDSNGVWRPVSIENAGLTFGTNGFYLPFTNSAGLGQDYSGTSDTTVVQKNTYNAGSEINEGDLAANPATGMLFVPIASGTVSKIELNASSRGFSGVTVRLETDSGSGQAPSGTLVTNGEVTGITSSGSGLKTATFSTPPEVTAGVKYWIVLRGDTGTWGWQHDVAGVGPALGLYQGSTQGYYSGRGVGHYVYMTGNHFTAVNSPTQTTDSPTTNFATLSSLSYILGAAVTLSDGNLSAAGTAATVWNRSLASISLQTAAGGKYIWAVKPDAVGGGRGDPWITNESYGGGNNPQTQSNAWTATIDTSSAFIESDAGTTTTHAISPVAATGDYILCAIDLDNNKVWWGLYDVSTDTTKWADNSTGFSGDPTDGGTTANATLTGEYLSIGVSVYTGRSCEVDFGQGVHDLLSNVTIPTGYKFINAANLFASSAPTIEDGSAHFQSMLWSGTGNVSRTINTQAGNSTFVPDLLWIKERNHTNPPNIFDEVRSEGSKNLQPSNSNAENTEADWGDFVDGGFSITGQGQVASMNTSGRNYVGWTWLAGNTTGSSNTEGRKASDSSVITSTVSVNQTAGFSIVSWQGNGENSTIGHGLGAVPKWIIVKNRDSAGNNWAVYHVGTDNTHVTFLDTNGTPSATDRWQDTTPTTTVFSVDGTTDVNKSSDDMIAYCWAEVPGFSKFGSFSSGSSGDPFVECGFTPALIFLKRTSANDSWYVQDTARDPNNPAYRYLQWNDTAVEASNSSVYIDIISNGFVCDLGGIVTTNDDMIFGAWAENPFAGTTPITAR